MADQPLLTLFLQSDPIISTYIKEIANGMMLSYKRIVQTGEKAGQTYYDHALSGVLVIDRLREPRLGLQLQENEVRCLYSAYTVHDLNKIPPYSERRVSYATLATDEAFAEELRRLGIERFFPQWVDYLPDIAALARLHQEHLAVTTEGLDRRQAVHSRLGMRRREQLAHLLRAADTVDLSSTLDATDRHKVAFLRELHAALDTGRWRFITHALGEQRGLLTNIVHNAVVETMRDQYQAIDLLYYAEGVAYLVPEGVPVTWGESQSRLAAHHAEQRLAGMQRGKIGQFVKGSNTGIQVDAAALESGAGFLDILAQIRLVVEGPGGAYSAKSVAKRESDIRGNDLTPALAQASDPALRVVVEALLAEDPILPTGTVALRCASLIDAYRNLLSRHLEPVLKRRKSDAWHHVYDLLETGPEQQQRYALIHPTRRAYFMVRDLPFEVDVLYDRLAHDLADLTSEGQATTGAGFMAPYLATHLSVAGMEGVMRDFQAPLRRYVHDQHEQCCHCGNAFPAESWMSANAPPSLNVQLFSTRLEGGSSAEPKRMICPVCRAQFILEKLAWPAHRDKRGAEQATYFLHLFAKTHLTMPLLKAWYGGLDRLRVEETDGSFIIDSNAFFQRRLESDAARNAEAVSVSVHKVNGIALPQVSEAIGNVPVLAVNAPGSSMGEQFLFVLEKALVLQQFMPSKLVLTRSPVPPLTPPDQVEFLVDGVPHALQWLLPQPELDARAVGQLLNRLAALQAISRRLYQPRVNESPLLDLIEAANDDPLGLYYVADRLIERKVAGGDADRQALGLTRAIAPYLKALAG